MEYQFVQDPASGKIQASFSLEHEIIGPWLESELANNTQLLTQVLTALDEVSHHPQSSITIAGHEYSITVEGDEVIVQANGAINGAAIKIPENLSAELHDFDQGVESRCGIEDFREMLHDWSQFVKV